MKDLIEYIINPVSKGVYKIIIDFNKKELVKSLLDFLNKSKSKIESEKIKTTSFSLSYINQEINIYKKYVEKKEDWLLLSILGEFFQALLLNKSLFDKDIINLYKRRWSENDCQIPGDGDFFNTENIFFKHNDAFIVENEMDDKGNFRLEAYCFDRQTYSDFLSIIERLLNKDSFKVHSIKKSHRTEDVIKPYFAILLILRKIQLSLFEDFILDDFDELEESINWKRDRLAIILSGVILEEILSRLYEDVIKKEVPKNAGLGFLIKTLFKNKPVKIKIPNEICSNLYDDTRELRNNAVHRGEKYFSKEEILKSLKGTFRLYFYLKRNQKKLHLTT
jgi:hypothetical protein